jgi:predicted branched-subunit amino acid permease
VPPPDVTESRPPRVARREFFAGCRAIAPVLVGTVPFGLVAGIAAVGAGMTPVEGIALSVLAFSGIAQLVVAQLIASQSPVVLTLAAALVVSLRFLMYSAALSPHLAHLPRRWRIPLSYLMTDQVFAIGVTRLAEPGERRDRHYYLLGAGLTLFTAWQASVVAGALAGAQVPAAWSLDFVVTLTFLALLAPALRTRADFAAASVAGAIALVAAGLPYRLSLVVASLAGIAAGLATERAHRR